MREIDISITVCYNTLTNSSCCMEVEMCRWVEVRGRLNSDWIGRCAAGSSPLKHLRILKVSMSRHLSLLCSRVKSPRSASLLWFPHFTHVTNRGDQLGTSGLYAPSRSWAVSSIFRTIKKSGLDSTLLDLNYWCFQCNLSYSARMKDEAPVIVSNLDTIEFIFN